MVLLSRGHPGLSFFSSGRRSILTAELNPLSLLQFWHMPGKISQRSIGEMGRLLVKLFNHRSDVREILCDGNFPSWLIQRSQEYAGNWLGILWGLQNGTFFFPHAGMTRPIAGVMDDPLFDELGFDSIGDFYVEKLAAFVVRLTNSDPPPGITSLNSDRLRRLLQLDGFDVDEENIRLIPLEGPVRAQEEEDRLTKLVKASGLPAKDVVLKHLQDAHSLYGEGKHHSSLGESRSFIQALIDGISIETDSHGKHSRGLPGGTGPRIEYLKAVGFLTSDEQAAFNSAWGTLSAGSHPGVPEQEQARIMFVLALEFGQFLLIKFTDWRANAYSKFSSP